MKWKPGRQGTGYYVWKILSFPHFDMYLLKYPESAHIPPHRDDVIGKKHYRVNLILWNADDGGEFKCEKVIFRAGPLTIFRPDLYIHEVSEIRKGIRYVLSIGFAFGNISS